MKMIANASNSIHYIQKLLADYQNLNNLRIAVCNIHISGEE